MLHDHEVDGAHTEDAVQWACVLTGDLRTRLVLILSGLELDGRRMRDNLDASGGLICSDASC
jgi:3-carboxy-cis,cis-muconate cycloisomerase